MKVVRKNIRYNFIFLQKGLNDKVKVELRQQRRWKNERQACKDLKEKHSQQREQGDKP